MGIKVEMAGKKFGRLEVIREAGRDRKGGVRWFCKCACGNETVVASTKLTQGRTRSCGCIQIESRIKHGYSHTNEYHIWNGIVHRCRNKNNHAYTRYGNVGIDVCEEWFESFENFYADMGARPSKNHTIDRVDNNKGYSKENCRWATMTEQQRNKTNNRMIQFNGKNMCLSEWCEVLNMPLNTLRNRLVTRKWSVERSLTTPVRKKRKAA